MKLFGGKRKRDAIWASAWAEGFQAGLEVAPEGKVLIPVPELWPLHAMMIDKDLRYRNTGGERVSSA